MKITSSRDHGQYLVFFILGTLTKRQDFPAHKQDQNYTHDQLLRSNLHVNGPSVTDQLPGTNQQWLIRHGRSTATSIQFSFFRHLLTASPDAQLLFVFNPQVVMVPSIRYFETSGRQLWLPSVCSD